MSRRLVSVLLLAVACGDSARPRASRSGTLRQEIIGGVTDPGHWYVVMVGDSSGGFCSGSLISKRTVITAGHCWGTGADAITRVFFEYGNPRMTTTMVVQSSVRHPGYDDFSLTNDLAMVQLAADAPVQPVPLLRETLGASFLGPSFTWVGYGDTNANGTGFGTRRVVTFPIQLVGPQSNIFVPQSAPSGASDAIDATQFYYQVLNKNTCTGDSGGPGLVVRNGVERHAGITSFGDDDCAYDGVVARTDAPRLSWIQQNIEAWEPNAPCRSDGLCGSSCVSTSPSPLGRLDDPDCADQHCGADGVCVISCSPVDPDCASLAIDSCRADGVCKPGCGTPDVDCAGGTGGGGGGSGGGAAGGTGGGSGGGGGSAGGSVSGTGGGGTVSGTGGTGGGDRMDEQPHGCSSTAGLWTLLALLTVRISRRRRGGGLSPPGASPHPQRGWSAVR